MESPRMKHVDVSFAEDRTVLLQVDGASKRYCDLGSALSAVRDEAAEDGQPIFVQINDSESSRSVVIGTDGSVSTSELSIVRPQAGTIDEDDQQSAEDPALKPTAGPAGESAEAARGGWSASNTAAAGTAASAAAGEQQTAPSADAQAGGTSGAEGTAEADEADETASAQKPGSHRGSGSFLSRLLSEDGQQQGSAQQQRARRRSTMTVPAIVLSVLLVIVVVLWVIPRFIGGPDGGLQETSSDTSGHAEQPKLSLKQSDTPIPGFESTAAWEAQIDPSASVTASARGVVVIKGSDVEVLNSKTGKKRAEFSMDGDVQIAADTIISGKRALLLRSGDQAFVLQDSDKKPREYTLPKNAEISLAGTSPMISSDGKLFHFHGDDVHPIAGLESGYTPMGLDGRKAITATFDGDVAVTDTETGLTEKFALEKPGRDLTILRWVTAGHGKIVTVWGPEDTDLDSSEPVQVVVSDSSQGKIVSTVEATAESVADAKWERGQGFNLAVFGPYLFDMKSGLLVRDGTDEDVRFGEPRGRLMPAVASGKPAIIEGDAAYETNNNLMAVGPDSEYAVVRSESDTIRGYARIPQDG